MSSSEVSIVHPRSHSFDFPGESPLDADLTLDMLNYEKKQIDAIATTPNDFITLGGYALYLSTYPKRRDEASAVWERCLSTFPQVLPSYLYQAYSYYSSCYATFLETTDTIKAELLYLKALELDPSNPTAMGDYSVFQHKTKKDYKAAKKAYEEALDVHPSHSAIWTKFANFQKTVKGDLKAAEVAHVNACKFAPKSADSNSAYAVFLHGSKGDFDSAELFYERAYSCDDTHTNNLSNYGLFMSEIRQDYSKASVLYERAITVDSSHANALYNYAVMNDSGTGNQTKAEELYRQCLEVMPCHAYAVYNLAVLVEEVRGLSITGKMEAEDLFARACGISPNDAQTLADYGRFRLVTCNDVDGAEELLKKSVALDTNCVVANYNLGMLYIQHRGKMVDEACKLFNNVLASDSNHLEAYQQLARISNEKGDGKEADRLYKKAINCKGVDGSKIEKAKIEYDGFRTGAKVRRKSKA